MPATESSHRVPPPEGTKSVSARELLVLLADHFKLTPGRYSLVMELQISAGMIGPSPTDVLPGAMIRLAEIGIAPTDSDGPMTIEVPAATKARAATRKREAE